MSLLLLLRPDYTSFTPASFHGGIDEVAIYDRALSASRIRQHFQTSRAIPGAYMGEVIADVPKAYWRLNESGLVAVDSSGGGNDGTYQGTTFTTSPLSVAEAANSVALYFRQTSLDENTQLDLDGITQAELDSAKAQPDLGIALYSNRIQADLDIEDQEELDGDTQFALERVPDNISQAYIEVKLTWTAISTVLTVLTGNGAGYTFSDLPLMVAANPYVIMVVDIEDNTVRFRLFQSDEAGNMIDAESGGLYDLLYDRTITDPLLFKRRKGRFGWHASFADGDAALSNIRPRGFTFGEVVTKSLQSTTPVEGAALTTHTSADRVLFDGIPSAARWGGVIEVDSRKTSSGKALKVITDGRPIEGVRTGHFILDDFTSLSLKFDLFFPSSALTTTGLGLEAFLYGENGRVIPVNLGGFLPDRWQTLRVRFHNDYFQSGEYTLVIAQTTPTPAVWWVDNFNLRARSVDWAVRANRPDPWGMAEQGWVDFKDEVNRDGSGARVEAGKEFQLRGRARRLDSFISEIKATPKYIEPSNFYWPDAHAAPTSIPDAVMLTPIIDARTVILDGTGSTCSGGTIVAYHWSLGDGSEDYGPRVRHTYIEGTYAVTLTVIDNNGVQSSSTRAVSV